MTTSPGGMALAIASLGLPCVLYFIVGRTLRAAPNLGAQAVKQQRTIALLNVLVLFAAAFLAVRESHSTYAVLAAAQACVWIMIAWKKKPSAAA